MVFHAAGSADSRVRGGKREPGESPGLPRSGERERQPSESCAQARGGNSTGPDQPGKRRPVGSVNGDAAPVSPKTCQRAARDNARGGSGRAGRPTSTAPAQKAGGRLRRVLVWPGPPERAREERAMTKSGSAGMQVRKRNGDSEPVDVNKIVRAVQRCAVELDEVDPLRVATKTISGLYDGATTRELDQLSIQTAAEMTGEEPQYSRLAARLLAGLHRQGSPRAGHRVVQPVGQPRPRRGADRRRRRRRSSRTTRASSTTPSRTSADWEFEYFGLKTVYDRYLLRHPTTRLRHSRPRSTSCCGSPAACRRTAAEAIELLPAVLVARPTCPARRRCSTRAPATRRCRRCFLLDSPRRRPRARSTTATPRSPCSEVLRRHRHRLVTASGPAAR